MITLKKFVNYSKDGVSLDGINTEIIIDKINEIVDYINYMENSNKKSKCCKECNAYKNIDGTDKFYWECNNPSCPCHKPSVEVILHKFDSGCLSGCKLDHSENTCDHYDSDCNRCGKLEREHNPLPQSIPLDRDEGEDKCCCYLYDCELGCRERQCCCIPEYTHKVKDHTPLKYRDFFEIKFPTLPTQRTIRKGRSYQCQRRDIY